MRLIDFAADKYSQFGEDGMIEHIFSIIGGGGTCVEFGAADGTSCSNTRKLWEAGWTALLVEGDPDRCADLETVTEAFLNCLTVNAYLTPKGINSIDSILQQHGITIVDFMSIDVDGIDYQIWESMQIHPRVICIEYNQSIPPHISLHQMGPSDQLGSSAKALVELAARKDYCLVGLNKANLFFVTTRQASLFGRYECDLKALFPREDLSYIATDYQGRPFVLGSPPWGLSSVPYTGETVGDPIHMIGHYLDLIKHLENEIGHPALFIGQDWECSPAGQNEISLLAYRRVFNQNCPHIIIDVANQVDLEDCRWVEGLAKEYGYKMRTIGTDLFVFTKEEE